MIGITLKKTENGEQTAELYNGVVGNLQASAEINLGTMLDLPISERTTKMYGSITFLYEIQKKLLWIRPSIDVNPLFYRVEALGVDASSTLSDNIITDEEIQDLILNHKTLLNEIPAAYDKGEIRKAMEKLNPNSY
jgi:hypothetical protein